MTVDLSTLANLSKIFYNYRAPEEIRNTIPSGSKLKLNNGNNLQNNLLAVVKFNYAKSVLFEDMKEFEMCFDDDISEEFLNANVQIVWEGGTEDYTAISLVCN